MLLSWGTQKPDSLNNFPGRSGIEAFLKNMKSKGRNISNLQIFVFLCNVATTPNAGVNRLGPKPP